MTAFAASKGHPAHEEQWTIPLADLAELISAAEADLDHLAAVEARRIALANPALSMREAAYKALGLPWPQDRAVSLADARWRIQETDSLPLPDYCDAERNARQKGLGRPSKQDIEQRRAAVRKLRAEGFSLAVIALRLGTSKATVCADLRASDSAKAVAHIS